MRKALAVGESVAWRRKPDALTAAGRRKLARKLRGLADEQVALGSRLRKLWHARARPSNFNDTHRRLMRSVKALRQAATALERGRAPAPPPDEPLTPAGVLHALRASLAP